MMFDIERSLPCFILLLFALCGMTAMNGCTDNPIEDDDHAEIHGLILRNDSAVEILRIEEDSILINTLTIPVDSTATYELHFLGHHGETVLPEVEILPAIESSDSTRVRAALTTGQNWSVSFDGRSAGSAEISIVLRHGGHDDFRSPPFTVVVE